LVQAVERGASALRASIERLGVDEALFERARAAKAQLVGRAQISGTKLVPGGEPSGPSREDLEQAVAANPEDVAARRQLAGALVAAGEGRRALEQCRWFYHHRQADADIVAELERLAQPGEMVAAGAQRLLGAIFRRDGQFMRSALHYQLALELQLSAGAGTKNKDEGR
jgi:hypothetical protein